ncbi:MAG: isoprenylcysteine carboxylmethyltransferase family protein [Anaerolineales bacterium]
MPIDLFHTVFVAGFLLFMVIRVYYHRRAAREGGRMNGRDSRLSVLLRLALAIPLVGTLAAYMIRPGLLSWAEVSLPEWVRWFGVGLTAISFLILIWVQEALGANFNTILGVRDRHTLVTHGPYRWVRHPMYDVLFVYMLSILLLTANLLVGGLFMGGFLITIGTRVAKEEAILEEAYGEAYRAYRGRTGRFLPRIRAGV